MLLLKWDEELKEWTSKIIRLLTTAIVKKAQPGGIIILKEVHPIITAAQRELKEEQLGVYNPEFPEYTFLNLMGKIPPGGFTRQKKFSSTKKLQMRKR